MDQEEQLVLLGRIKAAHGLKGEVKIAAFTAVPEGIAAYGPLRSVDGSRVFVLCNVRPANGAEVIASVDGITDRTAAERLRGVDLYLPARLLPPPGEGEFYHAELIGLDAFSPDGTRFGKVAAVHNFGAGDMLEIAGDADAAPLMLPFTVENVPEVDVANRRISVVFPEPDDG
jgi:16S rRNA processing protein RimM